jgi:hypothetical protein
MDKHPRAARAVLGTVVKLREVLPEALSDPHGWPRLASCGDVARDPRKVRAVAREIYSDLEGLEDSRRRIEGEDWKPITSVEQRFPRGAKDLESVVADTCRDLDSEAKPFQIIWSRVSRELGLVS